MADTVARIVLTAEDKTASAMANLRNGLAGIESRAASLRGVFSALTPALSLGGVAAYFKHINDGIDALNDLHDATGASIENISALEDVAARTGTSFDTVGTALVKLNKLLNEAKPDSDAARALKAIGLEAAALKDIDPAEALRRTAVALAGYADDGNGNKARLVQELFGRSLREVAPLLKDLAEKGRLNATVTTQQAEEAEKFNKQIYEFQKNSKDAGRAIVSDLIPALSQLAQEFSIGMKYADGFFDAVFTYGFKYGPDRSPAQQISAITNELARLKQLATQGGIQKLVDGERIDADIKKLEKALGYFKELQRLRLDYSPSNESEAEARRLGLSKPAPSLKFGGTPAPEKGKAAPFAGLTYDEKIKQQIGRLFEESDLIKAQEYADTLAQLDRLFFDNGISAELYDSALKKLAKTTEATGAAGAKKLAEEGRAVFDATRTDAEKLNIEMARLDDLLEKGAIDWDTYARATMKAAEGFGEGGGAAKDAMDITKDLGLTFSSAFEDAIVGGKGLQDVLKGLEADIMRIVTRRLVTEPLDDWLSETLKGFGKAGGGGGESGGNAFTTWIGKLFSFDGGGYTGPGARSGGLDGRGGFLALMHPDETVVDHARIRDTAAAAPSMNVTNVFHLAGPADRRTQTQIAAQAGLGVQRALARNT